jgi:hypothetical protein
MSLAGVDSAYLLCSSLSFSIKHLSEVGMEKKPQRDRELYLYEINVHTRNL